MLKIVFEKLFRENEGLLFCRKGRYYEMKDDLDLEQLAMPVCFYDPEALAEMRVIYERVMNDDSPFIGDDTRLGYDIEVKDINKCIYGGSLIAGLGVAPLQKCQVERMEHLFGLHGRGECFDWLEVHDAGDPSVAEILIADAFVTGKWKELPDELQSEYHRRKGAASLLDGKEVILHGKEGNG